MSKFTLSSIWLTTLIFNLMLTHISGIMFYLQPNQHKCLKEDLLENEFLLGDYFVYPSAGQIINFIARDSKGQLVGQHQNITKGRYKFTTDQRDTHEICFYSNVTQTQLPMYPQVVVVNSKKGVEAKELETLKEQSGKLKNMEIQLKRLEYLADAVVAEFLRIHKEEKARCATNERINRLVSYLNIFCMFGMLALTLWQIFYLFKYFQAKKLIDF